MRLYLHSSSAPRVLDPRVVTFTRSDSFEAEQFRRLRHRLEDLALKRRTQVVAVTSAASGEGKTMTAVNLAGALAQARGARVLLLDADLRRPRVAETCGLPADAPGLIAMLRQGQPLRSAVVQVPDTALDVLTCERSRIDPYDVLRSSAFSEALAQARREYRFVVVDTAPVVPVPDSSLLGPLVDGYLVVVAANHTPRKLLGEALNSLEPASVLGLVLNRDPEPLFGYYDTYGQEYFSPRAQPLEPADR